MDELPPNATAASQDRYQLARELAMACPIELGREIALTGSAAQGLADEQSDVELNVWVDDLPSADRRRTWLQSIGASDAVIDREQISDGSFWSDFRFRDCPVEAGWQSIPALVRALEAIVSGETLDHERVVLASMVERAIVLRSDGLLTAWKLRLAQYPEGVQERLIAEAIGHWTPWSFPGDRIALALRRDHAALALELVGDVRRVMRILFALNRRWEPGWKWMAANVRPLPTTPDSLVERIEAIFTRPKLEQRVEVCLGLIRETVALVPPSVEGEHVMHVIDQARVVASRT